MSDELKTVVIDGEKWEEEKPYCELCGAHMGDLYNPATGEFKRRFNDYGTNTCPECGQKYRYEEGDVLVLNKSQLDLLRYQQHIKHNSLKKGE